MKLRELYESCEDDLDSETYAKLMKARADHIQYEIHRIDKCRSKWSRNKDTLYLGEFDRLPSSEQLNYSAVLLPKPPGSSSSTATIYVRNIDPTFITKVKKLLARRYILHGRVKAAKAKATRAQNAVLNDAFKAAKKTSTTFDISKMPVSVPSSIFSSGSIQNPYLIYKEYPHRNYAGSPVAFDWKKGEMSHLRNLYITYNKYLVDCGVTPFDQLYVGYKTVPKKIRTRSKSGSITRTTKDVIQPRYLFIGADGKVLLTNDHKRGYPILTVGSKHFRADYFLHDTNKFTKFKNALEGKE